MKLNLGCGDRYAEGWRNTDLPSMPHRKDNALDMREPLGILPDTITHVYAGHVFEHLTTDDTEVFLARLLPCMAVGGELMIVGPDVAVAQQMIGAGAEMHGATLDSLRFGAGRWEGDVHLWDWSSPLQAEMLARIGWPHMEQLHINDVPAFWPVADRNPQWQRAVHAVRTS